MNPPAQIIGELTGLLGVMIPIIAIALGLGIVFWSIYWDHQKKRLQYQERQLMIEKGLTPPPILPEESRRRPEDSLRRGTVLLFLGIGLAVGAALARQLVEENFGGVVGVAAAIVGFLGVGNLVYYFIARRTAKNADIAPLS